MASPLFWLLPSHHPLTHTHTHTHTQNEVAERRAFVTRTKQTLVKVYNNLESDYVKNKIANDERDVRPLMSTWLCLV